LLNREKTFVDLKWRVLPADKFPSGLSYFFKNNDIPNPVVVHANYNPHGTEGKTENLKGKNLWQVDDKGKCK
jgi:hypothetical protein